MKNRSWLLTFTAILEALTGLFLIALPTLPMELPGLDLTAPTTLIFVRLAGLALLVIGIICYLARRDQPGPASTGVIVGVMIYDIGVIVLLAYAGIALKQANPLTWSIMALHGALVVWCVMCLQGRRAGG